MTSTHLQAIQVIILFLLFLVAVFAAIAERIKIPYPILLTLAGVGIAFVPHVPRIPPIIDSSRTPPSSNHSKQFPAHSTRRMRPCI